MPSFKSIGDRMKFYEDLSNGKQLMPLLPAIIRLDGRAFHSFTKGLSKPFDAALMRMMLDTTIFLVEETNAVVGYTQSDEITLILHNTTFDSQIYFDGSIPKITSVLAGVCANFFNGAMSYLPTKAHLSPGKRPVFDCRCFNVPNETEAVNCLVWREQDATRNSIQMVGQAYFSHKELQNKSCDDIQEMLFKEHLVNWNHYTPSCRRGTYVQRHMVTRPFTADEITVLPPKHEARANPGLMIERSEIRELKMPPITKVTNAADVVFRGADPDWVAEKTP